ncbi:hypothetical protein N9I19_14605 [Peribacillus sp. CSMR9]|nr:hypothetical protein [Peribacillus sp. CSMR9]
MKRSVENCCVGIITAISLHIGYESAFRSLAKLPSAKEKSVSCV